MVGDGSGGACREFIFEYSAGVGSCGFRSSFGVFVLVGGVVFGTVAGGSPLPFLPFLGGIAITSA